MFLSQLWWISDHVAAHMVTCNWERVHRNQNQVVYLCSGVIRVSGAIHNSYNHLELPSTCHYVQMELACWCVYTQDIDSFFEIFCLWHFSDLMICFQTQTYLLQFLVKTIFVSTSPNRLVEEVVSRALDFIPPTLQLMEWGCEPHHLH